MLDLLLEIKKSVDHARDKQPGLSQIQLAGLEQRYDRLIEQRLQANPQPEADIQAPHKRCRYV